MEELAFDGSIAVSERWEGGNNKACAIGKMRTYMYVQLRVIMNLEWYFTNTRCRSIRG